MSTVTVRLPEQKRLRLQQLARARGITVNQLLNQLASEAIDELDAEGNFRARALQGSAARGIATLDLLDRHFQKAQK